MKRPPPTRVEEKTHNARVRACNLHIHTPTIHYPAAISAQRARECATSSLRAAPSRVELSLSRMRPRDATSRAFAI